LRHAGTSPNPKFPPNGLTRLRKYSKNEPEPNRSPELFSILTVTMPLKFPSLALTAALAMIFTLSCSDTDNMGNDRISSRKERVSGVSQKGPFAEGANVKVYELNRNMERVGEPYQGTTDGNGNFVIEMENVILSPYVSLEVSGKYFNEVSGEQSDGTITLNAVADVSKKNVVNINVFTHLEYDKVIKLAQDGEKFEVAKKAAQKEVLNALGIDESVAKNKSSEDMSLFGSSPSDSVLLVASVLLQATSDVSSLLDEISSEIKDNGTLNVSTKAKVKSGLEYVYANMDIVMNNILKLDSSARVPSRDDIKEIVKGIDSDTSRSVPLSSSSIVRSSSSLYLSSSSRTPSSSGSGSYYSSSGGINYSSSSSSSFRDSRDDKTYKWVKIGTQTWMAENLNYNAVNSKCYNNVTANCTQYGRLYDWATAMGRDSTYNDKLYGKGDEIKIQGICPNGWHIPNKAEWDTLMTFVGDSTAGTKLKAAKGWNNDDNGNSGNGTDDYDFSALPGGRGQSSGYFDAVGYYGNWWSASESDSNVAYRIYMRSDYKSVEWDTIDKSILFSVRCLQD